MWSTRRTISSVAAAVARASSLTSPATTAKPRPASPARAASIVALRASRFVCSAIAEIVLTTAEISPDPAVRLVMTRSARPAAETPWAPIDSASSAQRATSSIASCICCVAVTTLCIDATTSLAVAASTSVSRSVSADAIDTCWLTPTSVVDSWSRCSDRARSSTSGMVLRWAANASARSPFSSSRASSKRPARTAGTRLSSNSASRRCAGSTLEARTVCTAGGMFASACQKARRVS